MRPSRILLFVGILAIAAFIAWRYTTNESARAKPVAGPPPPIPVDVATVARADMPIYLTGLGTVQAFNTVTVTSRVDGEIVKIAFTEGQDVRAGDLLAVIDPRPYQAAYDQAVAKKAQDEAQLANSRRDLERYQTLSAQNYTSKQTLDTTRSLVDQLEAQVRGDQAAIDMARTQLDYTRIAAPIGGRLGIRQIDIGNVMHAASANPIVVITQLQPISLIFTLPEDDLSPVSAALAKGPVSVTAFASDGTTPLDVGSLMLVDNQIDQTTGTIRLKASMPNPQNKLWPGAFVNARIQLGTRADALTAPTAAVQRGANGLYAYVVKSDNTVEVRKLKLADDSGPIAVIDDGLKDGDRVVTGGAYRLQPGSNVQIRPPIAANASDKQ